MSLDGYGSGPHPAWLDTDWSQHLKWLHVQGRRVNVLDVGSGPALVFIHGHSGCWQHWLEQLPAFIDDHRIIAMDLPGFGYSEMPSAGVSMTGYGQVVAGILEELDAHPAVVVGNSMGGFVAAELAIQAPHLVEKLVLVAAAGMSSKYIGLPTEFIRHPTAATGGRVLFSVLGVPEAQARELAARPRGRRLALGLVCRHPEALHPAIVFELIRGAGRPAAAPAAVALAEYDFKDRVPEIAAPTLIVWGDRDRLVPLSSAHLYEDAIEDATMVVYDRTGHVPMIERPERFNADLRAFIADVRVGEEPEEAIEEHTA
jgi:pimeloyl-ACP methyl ester carboxylesterase